MLTRLIASYTSRAVKTLCGILSITGLSLLLGCNNTETPLRVAFIPWPSSETLHLAENLNYFDAKSIRIVHMANSNQISMALRNNSIHAALFTLDEALSLLQDGIDLQVILIMDISNGADVVMARPEITDLKALRGKRVAVDNATIGAVMLDAMLNAAELKVGDIQLLSKPINEHSQAYLRGQIDAAITYEPVRSELLKHGARILFDSSQIPGRIIDVMVVRRNMLNRYDQALKQLVAAHFRALDYLARHPQDAAQHIAPYLGIQPSEVAEQYQGLIIPNLAENHRWLGASAKLHDSADSLAKLMLRAQILQRSPPIADLAQPRFLPALSP